MNEKRSDSLPLVSVVVITYNSAQYVEQTLESVLSQTYQGPIELIVSDDGSKDDTMAICEQWMAKHSSLFYYCHILQTPINLGICGNYNFALERISGDWIKYIAGDDVLAPECIEVFMRYAMSSGDKIIISGVECIDKQSNSKGARYIMEEYLDSDNPLTQAENLARYGGNGIVEGPSLFVQAALLRSIGGMNMAYPMLEDFPLVFKCAYQGYHVGVIKRPLVKYRVYPDSVSQSDQCFRIMYQQAVYDARKKIAFYHRKFIEMWHHHVMKVVSACQYNGWLGKIIITLMKCTDIYGFKSWLGHQDNQG